MARARDPSDAEAIPRYGLYGERDAAVDVEFLHVELIRNRSEALGWRIETHAHPGLSQLVLLLRGGVDLRLDDVGDAVEAPALVTVPAGTVHSFRFVPGTHGHVVTFARTWLDAAPLDPSVRRALFRFPRRQPLPDRQVTMRLEHLADLLLDEFAGSASGRDAMLPWLAQSLLVVAARTIPPSHRPAAERGDDAELVAALHDLVERHFHEHPATSEYADRLHVSTSTLDRACRAVTGYSTFELGQRRLELEARRRLVYIAAPIARIAAELGFDDPAYFSRFFRRRTGRSPKRYRADARAELTA